MINVRIRLGFKAVFGFEEESVMKKMKGFGCLSTEMDHICGSGPSHKETKSKKNLLGIGQCLYWA